LGASKTIFEPKQFLSPSKPCKLCLHRCWLRLQSEQNKVSHDPRHLEVPSGASKTISEPLLHSLQTMHLFWVKISNISKWTEMSCHLNLVTSEYHRVHLNDCWDYGTFGTNYASILHWH
jgi:hypothetical protein